MSAQRSYGVVIPVYNVQPDYFRGCLSSVIDAASRSRLTNIRVAVVDDASAESRSRNYARVVSDFSRHGLPISYVRQAYHQGIAASRARGIASLSTEWLLLLDSDDLLDPYVFDVLAQTPDSAVLVFAAHRKVTERFDGIIETRRKGRYQELLSMYAGTVYDPFLHYTFLIHPNVIRRSAYYAVGGFDRSILYGDEIDFHLRLTEHFRESAHYCYVDRVLYTYRDNALGVCRDPVRYRSLISNIETILLNHAKKRGMKVEWCRRVGKEEDGAVRYEYGIEVT